MKTFGLIGYPLSHSFSEKYFSQKFHQLHLKDIQYKNFPLEHIHLLPELIQTEDSLLGLNVTIPHKESVMPLLDYLDQEAKEAGAVNTLRIIRKNHTLKLEGYNTDIYGFSSSLKPFLKSEHQRALILGDGGAAKAVKFVFKRLGLDYITISRTPKPNALLYTQLNEPILKSHLLIVNTTPLGMHPETHFFPDIPYQFLTEHHFLYDLIYNPEETLFLKKGKESGATIMNGLSMLQLQAEKSWEIWNQ